MDRKIEKEIAKALEDFKDEEFNAKSIYGNKQDCQHEIGAMSEKLKKLYILYLKKLYEGGEAVKQVTMYNPYTTASDYLRGLIVSDFKNRAPWESRIEFNKLAKQAMKLEELLWEQAICDFPQFKDHAFVFKSNYAVGHNGKKQRRRTRLLKNFGKIAKSFSKNKASGKT